MFAQNLVSLIDCFIKWNVVELFDGSFRDALYIIRLKMWCLFFIHLLFLAEIGFFSNKKAAIRLTAAKYSK